MNTATMTQTNTTTSRAPATVQAGRPVLSEFTRVQVESALIAAGKAKGSTDSDIRRLSNVQIHMAKYGLTKIDNESIDDEITSRLLDFFCTVR